MFSRTRQISQTANYLDNVPNRVIDHQITDDDRVVLLRPKFMSGILAKHLQPHIKYPYYKVRLDEIGSSTWRAIDGARTVGEIADLLYENFGDNIEPRYERCSRFIYSLHQGKMVTLSASKPEPKE